MQKKHKGFAKRLTSILMACFMMLASVSAMITPVSALTDPAFPSVSIPEREDKPADQAAADAYYKYPFQNPNLSVDERVDDLLDRLTLDEKVVLAHQYSAAVVRLGLNNFRTGSEGEHGVSWHGYATVFPQGTGLGMTFDKKLLEQVGYVVGTEMRAYNSVDDTFSSTNVWSPVIDLNRDPRYGRTSEGMGEDPILTGLLATNYANGMKGYDPFYWLTQPTLKHFYGYGQEAQRNGYSASISPRNMHEYYLKVFELPISSGAATGLMTGYNLINGKPTMTSPELRSIVYEQWVGGYGDVGRTDGSQKSNPAFLTVTDASSPRNLYVSNAYYPNTPTGRAAAYADSIKNGVFAMTTTHVENVDQRIHTYEALARGFLTEDELDDAVRTQLTVRCHVGGLDADPISDYHDIFKTGDNPFDVPELVSPSYTSTEGGPETHPYSKLALETAEKQVVIMKNEGNILPLKPDKKVAVSGPTASLNATTFYGGSYAYTTLIDDEIKKKVTNPADFNLSRKIYAFKNASTGRYLTASSSNRGSALTVAAAADMDDTKVQANNDAARAAQFVVMEFAHGMHQLKSRFWDDDPATRKLNRGYISNANNVAGLGAARSPNHGPSGWIDTENRASQQWWPYGYVGLWNNNNAEAWDGTSNLTITINQDRSSSWLSVRLDSPSAGPGNGHLNASGNNTAMGAYNAANSTWTPVLIQGDEYAAEQAAAAVASQGVAVVCVGDQPYADSREEVDRPSTTILGDGPISLAGAQRRLIDKVKTAAPGKTVLVIVGSYSFEIDQYANDPQIAAIVYTSHAGQELGRAVANVLYGDTAPAGRLGETWYKDISKLPPINDYDIIKGGRTYQYTDSSNVTYPFGHGLTYANFTYGTLTGTDNVANIDTDDLIFSIPVSNGSSFDSDEVVQLYMEYSGDSIVNRPARKLVDFARQNIAGNDSETFTFTVPMHELAIWDVIRDDWYVEPGDYTFIAAKSSADPATAAQKVTVTVTGEAIGRRDITGEPVPAWHWDDVAWRAAGSSNYGNDVSIISAQENGDYYDQAYAIQSRVANSWVRYNNVAIAENNMGLTVRASNSGTSAGKINVYQVSGGTKDWTAANKIGEITVPSTGHIQSFVNVGAQTTSTAIDFVAGGGTKYDLIFEFSAANMGIKWFQSGPLADMTPADIQLQTFHYATESSENTSDITSAPTTNDTATTLTRHHVLVEPEISWASGKLAVQAFVDSRVVANSAPVWSVTGGGTINQSGIYQAPAAGDGTAVVTATFTLPDGATISKSTNIVYKGLAANDGVIAVQMRSGAANSVSEYNYHTGCYGDYGVIRTYEGTLVVNAQSYPTNQGTARALEYDNVIYSDESCTIPSDLAEWAGNASAGNITGNPGNQGSVTGNDTRAYNRTLKATGKGDGEVYVKATHTASGKVGVYKVIIENQGEWNNDPVSPKGVRDVFGSNNYARIEARMFDETGGGTSSARVDNVHGNDVGLQVNMLRDGNWLRFKNLDFGGGDLSATIKYMKILADEATFTLKLDDPNTGKAIATWTVTGGGTSRYEWKETDEVIVSGADITGVHDLYLVIGWPAQAAGSNPAWITNSNVNATPANTATGIRLGVNWIGFRTSRPTTPADKTALDELIAEAKEKNEGDYTAESWGAFMEALEKAESVSANDDATQGDVDEAAETLRNAMDALKEAEKVIEVISVKIDGAAIQQLRIRNTKQFNATVNPTNATDPSLTWESSNEKIFTVDENGLVKGVGTGSAKLIITAGNGKTSFIMVQITA